MSNEEQTPVNIHIGPRHAVGDPTHLHDFLQTVVACWRTLPELLSDEGARTLNLFVNGNGVSWTVVAGKALLAEGPSAASLVEWIEAQSVRGQDVIWP